MIKLWSKTKRVPKHRQVKETKTTKKVGWFSKLISRTARKNKVVKRVVQKQKVEQKKKVAPTNNATGLRFFWQSRLFNTVLIVIVIYMGYLTGQEFLLNFYQAKEMAKVEAQNSSIREDNQEALYLLEYYKTDTYSELEARKHLNLKKKGEEVMAIPVDIVVDNSVKQEEKIKYEERPNYVKWRDFFTADLSQLPVE